MKLSAEFLDIEADKETRFVTLVTKDTIAFDFRSRYFQSLIVVVLSRSSNYCNDATHAS